MSGPNYTAMTDEERDELGWRDNFDVFTEAEMSNLIALCQRFAKSEVHTLVECANPDCKCGVRNEYAPHGLCVDCAEAELMRLRGIEAAVLAGESPRLAVICWRVFAKACSEYGFPAWAGLCNSIAGVLEAK